MPLNKFYLRRPIMTEQTLKSSSLVEGQAPSFLKLGLTWSLPIAFCVLQFALHGSVGVMSGQIQEGLNINTAMISLVSSSFFYPYITMQVPVGLILDLFGFRSVASAALMLIALSCVGFGNAQSSEMAILARMGMGLGCSFGFVGMLVATKQLFGLRHFALLVTLGECLSMAGVAGLNGAFSKVALLYGWRVCFSAIGGISALLGGLIFFFAPPVVVAEESEGQRSADSFIKTLRNLMRIKEIWLGGIASGLIFSLVSVFVALWAIPFLVDSYQVDIFMATSAVSMIYLGIAIGSPFYGWLSGRIQIKYLMATGAILSLPFLLAIIYGHVPWMAIYALMFCVGISCAVYQLVFVLVSHKVSHKVQATAMGMTNMLTMAVAPLLQPVIGLALNFSQSGAGGKVVYTYTDYALALAILPAGLVVAFCLSLLLGEESKSQHSHG
jgi:MFS family permease